MDAEQNETVSGHSHCPPGERKAAREPFPPEFTLNSLDRLARSNDHARAMLVLPGAGRPDAMVWWQTLDRALRADEADATLTTIARAVEIALNSSSWNLIVEAAVADARAATEARLGTGRLRSLWGTTPIINLVNCVAADRRIGVEAENLVFNTYYITRKFDLELSNHVAAVRAISSELENAFYKAVLIWAAIGYDIFYFFNDRGILPGSEFTGRFTMGICHTELAFLRRADKLIYTLPYGADYRTRAPTVARSRYNFCTECPEIGGFCFCNEEAWHRVKGAIQTYATAMLSSGLAIEQIPGSRRLEHVVIDVATLQPRYPEIKGERVRIVHVPNHPHFKGTRHLRAALERFGEQTPFDYVEASGISNTEVIQLITSADVVVDQLLGGHFGMTALEAMGLGKPVISNVGDYSTCIDPSNCPIINADPDTIFDVLTRLVRNTDDLPTIGQQSRQYVERNYSIGSLADRLTVLYRETAGLDLRMLHLQGSSPGTIRSVGTPSDILRAQLDAARIALETLNRERTRSELAAIQVRQAYSVLTEQFAELYVRTDSLRSEVAAAQSVAASLREQLDEGELKLQRADSELAVALERQTEAEQPIAALQGEEPEYRALPPDFDTEAYLRLNPDVASSGIDPAKHYLAHGQSEGRAYRVLPPDFDADAYLQLNPDLASAGVNPAKHYMEHGRGEGRAYRLVLPNDFDAETYLRLNPDLAAADVNPAEHYLAHGQGEGRAYQLVLPNDFDAKAYLQLNPDIAAAGVDPAEHYSAYGRREGRPYRVERFSIAVPIKRMLAICFDVAEFGIECVLKCYTPAARAWRMRFGTPRTLWGVTPILTLPLLAHCDRLLGLRSQSLVFSTYYITQNFDVNLNRLCNYIYTKHPSWAPRLHRIIFRIALSRYDIYHYFYDRGIMLPTRRIEINEDEMRTITQTGHRLYTYAYGADVRIRDITLRLGQYNACVRCPAPMKYCTCDGPTALGNVERISKYASAMLATGDMIHYVPGGREFHYWPLDLNKIRYVGNSWDQTRPLRIAHSPNHSHFKGSEWLVEAIRRLQDEGQAIELVQVTGVSNHEVLKLFASCDIVADQFIIGAFGYTTLEGLASGKPVLCYLNGPDMVLAPERCPIINTSPDTIYEVLRLCLSGKIDLTSLGERGRNYVEHFYSPESTALRLGALYLETANLPERINRRIRGRMAELEKLVPPLMDGAPPLPWTELVTNDDSVAEADMASVTNTAEHRITQISRDGE